MPWEQSAPMDQTTQFVSKYLRDAISFTELCDRYGISRKTGYKWVGRYQTQGPAGLAAPVSSDAFISGRNDRMNQFCSHFARFPLKVM
jgi:transposase